MTADESNKNQNPYSKVYENHSHGSKDNHISIRSCVSNLMLKDDKTRILAQFIPPGTVPSCLPEKLKHFYVSVSKLQ